MIPTDLMVLGVVIALGALLTGYGCGFHRGMRHEEARWTAAAKEDKSVHGSDGRVYECWTSEFDEAGLPPAKEPDDLPHYPTDLED